MAFWWRIHSHGEEPRTPDCCSISSGHLCLTLDGIPSSCFCPKNDHAVFESFVRCSSADYTIAEAVFANFKHLWYLSEKLVALLLFDAQVCVITNWKIISADIGQWLGVTWMAAFRINLKMVEHWVNVNQFQYNFTAIFFLIQPNNYQGWETKNSP